MQFLTSGFAKDSDSLTEIIPLLGIQSRPAHLHAFFAPHTCIHAIIFNVQNTYLKIIPGSYTLREDSLLSTGVWQSAKRRDVTLSLVRVIYITTHAGE